MKIRVNRFRFVDHIVVDVVIVIVFFFVYYGSSSAQSSFHRFSCIWFFNGNAFWTFFIPSIICDCYAAVHFTRRYIWLNLMILCTVFLVIKPNHMHTFDPFWLHRKKPFVVLQRFFYVFPMHFHSAKLWPHEINVLLT